MVLRLIGIQMKRYGMNEITNSGKKMTVGRKPRKNGYEFKLIILNYFLFYNLHREQLFFYLAGGQNSSFP